GGAGGARGALPRPATPGGRASGPAAPLGCDVRTAPNFRSTLTVSVRRRRFPELDSGVPCSRTKVEQKESQSHVRFSRQEARRDPGEGRGAGERRAAGL